MRVDRLPPVLILSTVYRRRAAILSSLRTYEPQLESRTKLLDTPLYIGASCSVHTSNWGLQFPDNTMRWICELRRHL